MIGLPILLILVGLFLYFLTIYGTLGLILFFVGLVLAVAGYSFGWYRRRVL